MYRRRRPQGRFHGAEDICPVPGCPIKPTTLPDARCTCRDPIWIVIPAGSHIHLTCPVHGDQIIYGPPVVTCETKYVYSSPSPRVRWDTEFLEYKVSC